MKKYDFELLLKYSGGGYMLTTTDGRTLYVIRSRTRDAAEREARAWASSFNSVLITIVEENDEKDSQRTRVPNATPR